MGKILLNAKPKPQKVMETKKNSHVDLTNYRSTIMGFSFLLALLIVITAFEWKTYDDGGIIIDKPYYESSNHFLLFPLLK